MKLSDHTEPFEPRRTDPCFCGSGARFKNCCGRAADERPPPFGVILKRGWLDAAICDEWVSYLEEQPRSWLTIRDSAESPERVDPSRVTSRVELGDKAGPVNEAVARAYATEAGTLFGSAVEWFSPPTALRYSSGGHYAAHADSQVYDAAARKWVKKIDRDVSLLLYLNNDFDGGALAFTNFNYRFRPARGDLLLFPSDHRYRHRAEPVTAGTRYAIVSWAAVAGSERLHSDPPDAIRPP